MEKRAFDNYKHAMRRKVFTLAFMVVCVTLSAQRFNGFIHSDFSGIIGARVQPASIAGSPYKWDVSLINANFFVTNNIARLENDGESTVIRRFIDDRTKFLQANVGVGGLSVLISLPRNQAIGLQYQLRGHASANNFSPNFISQVDRFTDPRVVNSVVENESGQMAAALWRELSFTYAAVVWDDGYNRWKVGLTAKMINTYGSAFFELNDLDYAINGSGIAAFTNIQANFGYSANLDPYDGFAGDQSLSGLPPKNAFSAAFDAGVVFERRASRPAPRSQAGTRLEPDVDYEFRVSASITDLGIMEFAQGDASTLVSRLRPGLGTSIDFDALLSGVEGFSSLRDSVNTFAETEQLSGRYKISMPTALHLNYDYNFGNDWYLNANALVDLTGLMPVDYRLNYLHNLTITPRWEQNRQALYLPVYVNQIGNIHLGVAARFGIITFGTQNLGTLFTSKDTSAGFFFTLNLNQLVANSAKPYCFGTSRGSGMTRTKRKPLYKRKKFLFF